MRMLKNKLLASALVLTLGLSSGTAEAVDASIGRGYAKIDYRSLTQTFFSFYNGGNPSNDMLDEYAELAYCELYKDNFVNDFEWAAIRDSIKKDMKTYSSNMHKFYEIEGELKIGRYDFSSKRFPLHEDSALLGIGKLSLYNPNNYFIFCGRSGDLKSLPSSYTLSLYNPLELEEIQIDDKVAREIVEHIYQDTYGQRYFFARFRVNLLDYLGNRGAKIANNEVVIKGEVDSIDLFLDPEMTKKFHTIKVDN